MQRSAQDVPFCGLDCGLGTCLSRIVVRVVTSCLPVIRPQSRIGPCQISGNTSRHITAHHHLSKHKRLLLRQAAVDCAERLVEFGI